LSARETELSNLSVRQLKGILQEQKGNWSDCLEKVDFVRKILALEAAAQSSKKTVQINIISDVV
jgi:hypothetical protein